MHIGNVHIGTCGFSYDEWKGQFYPADLPAHEMLRYYSLVFSFVELDHTWYRIPSPAQLERMALVTPSDFRISLKVHRSLTHEVDEHWQTHPTASPIRPKTANTSQISLQPLLNFRLSSSSEMPHGIRSAYLTRSKRGTLPSWSSTGQICPDCRQNLSSSPPTYATTACTDAMQTSGGRAMRRAGMSTDIQIRSSRIGRALSALCPARQRLYLWRSITMREAMRRPMRHFCSLFLLSSRRSFGRGPRGRQGLCCRQALCERLSFR